VKRRRVFEFGKRVLHSYQYNAGPMHSGVAPICGAR
jgi:hypothetical protein